MNHKNNISFDAVKIPYVIFLFFITIVIGLYSIDKAEEINQRANDIFTQELKPLETIEDIKASMYRIRERAGRYITEPERQAIHKKKINEQLARIERNKNKYFQSRLGATETHLIQDVDALWQTYIKIIQTQVLPLTEQGKQELAEDILYGPALNTFRQARKALNSLSDFQIQRAEQRQRHAHSAYTSILQIVLGIIIFSIMIAIILNFRYRETKKAKKFSDLIIRNTAQSVMVTNRLGQITSVNKAFENITGYFEDDVYGQTPAILSSNKHDKIFYKKLWQSIKEKGNWEGEIWNKHKDGHIYPVWLNIVAFYTSNGEVEYYVGTSIDISPLKLAEQKANKLAYYDNLTELGNNHLLEERLQGLLDDAKQYKHQVGLILLDLNNFKKINAYLGREGGDILLRNMAKILKQVAPKKSLIIRYDSDRFMIVINVDHMNFNHFNKQLITFVEDLQKYNEFSIGNTDDIKVNWSIGITSSPRHGIDSSTLIEQANIALFHDKLQKHNGYYTFYNDKFIQQANHKYQLSLGIAKAIERNELFLVFQPQVTSKGNINGAEVLLRWNSKEFGFISPDIFIPLAEESGDIIKIGKWVLDNTLEQIKVWQENCKNTSGCFKRISINVSPLQLISSSITDDYAKIYQQSGIKHSLIEFEITETGIMNFSEDIIVKLKELTAQGFSIAIDDFGTGYSSLGRLQEFPVNILKIDRCFIMKIIEDEAQAAIVKYIISMAHTLNMEVIAEGVECKAEVDMLIEFGCDMFQGYYFAKPLVADDFINYIENKHENLLLLSE